MPYEVHHVDSTPKSFGPKKLPGCSSESGSSGSSRVLSARLDGLTGIIHQVSLHGRPVGSLSPFFGAQRMRLQPLIDYEA